MYATIALEYQGPDFNRKLVVLIDKLKGARQLESILEMIIFLFSCKYKSGYKQVSSDKFSILRTLVLKTYAEFR